MKISKSPTKGYYKSVGFYIKDGERKQRKFWLCGHDYNKSLELAEYIIKKWGWMKQYDNYWQEIELLEINDYKRKLINKPSKWKKNTKLYRVKNLPKLKRERPDTLYQAISFYNALVIPKLASTDKWKVDLLTRIAYIRKAITNKRLEDLGIEDLVQVVAYFGFTIRDKPSGFYKKKGSSYKGCDSYISPIRRRVIFQATKRLFDWLHESGYWTKPDDYNEFWRSDFDLKSE